MDKYATILRYGISYALASLATKYGLDAATTGGLTDAIMAVILSLATLIPMVYNLFTRPSTSAMKAAVAADQVLSGEENQVQVHTPSNVPDLTISPTRGNQG